MFLLNEEMKRSIASEPERMRLIRHSDSPSMQYAYPNQDYYKHAAPTRTVTEMPFYRAESIGSGFRRRSGFSRKGIGAAIIEALSGRNPPLRRSFWLDV